MNEVLSKLQKTSSMIGKSVSYLLLVMVLITVSVVIIRYIFESGSIALQESITYLHASLLIGAMGYCFQNNGHVRVDIFYQNLSDKKKAIVNIFGNIVLLIPFCIFCFWMSLPYVSRSWSILEKSSDAGGIPAVFLIKTLLLLLPLLLIFQACIEIIRNVLILKGKDIHEAPPLERLLDTHKSPDTPNSLNTKEAL